MNVLTPLAGLLASLLLVTAVGVQVAVAAGAPWGGFVYGGGLAEHGEVLPVKWRAMSALRAVVLLAFIPFLLDNSGWVSLGLSSWLVDAACLVLAAVMVLNTFGNLSGQHWIENRLFAVQTVLIASCAASVVLA